MRLVVDFFRTVVAGIAAVIGTILAVAVILVTAQINSTSPLIDRVIRGWSRMWLITTGTKLVVRGQEHVDPSRSYFVVANHQSLLDIMACFLAVRLPIRFLAKTELFEIPVFAQGMRAVGIIEVDRSAHAAIHAQVNRQAKELIEKRRSVIIYAEGTRPRDGVMRPFKKGAFTMAIASQLPVLPVSIHGSFQAWPPGQPWAHGGTIEMVIDPAIDTAGMGHADVGELRDRVYGIIAGHVIEMGGPVEVPPGSDAA